MTVRPSMAPIYIFNNGTTVDAESWMVIGQHAGDRILGLSGAATTSRSISIKPKNIQKRKIRRPHAFLSVNQSWK